MEQASVRATSEWVSKDLVRMARAATTEAEVKEVTRVVEAYLIRISRLEEALTPSGDTKTAYIGEFSWDERPDDHFGGPVTRTVPWTTIKEIMAAIGKRGGLDE